MVGIMDRLDITSDIYKGRQDNPDQEKVVGITDRPDITSAVNKGRCVNPAKEKCGWYNGPSRHNLRYLQRPSG